MKFKKSLALAGLALALGLSSCGGNEQTVTPTPDEPKQEEPVKTPEPTPVPTEDVKPTPTPTPEASLDNNPNMPQSGKYQIFLAGDSTVKTYNDNQFIGGWGQFLGLFTDENATVYNCAQGGRSSRSFINEGRLYNIEGNTYSFKENNGKSIEDCIKQGDYLFIQFGHNDDDTKKASSISTLYDRMVPLGQKDANGKYPVTAGVRVETTSLPKEYTDVANEGTQRTALAEIAKYGSTYYSYDCGGTYKWYLKQYIDFARSKGATPVLVTPVARVKFSGNEIVGGAGLHGENFAYVEAVRQLAEEENCLLVDLFSQSKKTLETATPTYANYLMALKPNELVGTWPVDFDYAYENKDAGYTGIEATHYNKYGAYLQAAYVAQTILNAEKPLSNQEGFYLKSAFKDTPSSYVDPSNKISREVVEKLEALTTVNVTNPNRTSTNPQELVAAIDALPSVSAIDSTNYEATLTKILELNKKLAGVNVDDLAQVTNASKIEVVLAKCEEVKEASTPDPIKTVVYNADALAEVTATNQTINAEGFKVIAAGTSTVSILNDSQNVTHNGVDYSVTNCIDLKGSQKADGRYIEFSVEGACKITVLCKGGTTQSGTTRVLQLKNGSTAIGTFEAPAAPTKNTLDVKDAGTYTLGSASSGIRVYLIIIEYFA